MMRHVIRGYKPNNHEKIRNYFYYFEVAYFPVAACVLFSYTTVTCQQLQFLTEVKLSKNTMLDFATSRSVINLPTLFTTQLIS